MDPQTDKESRIRIGISHGDINGISYEIIIKTFQDQRLFENYTIIVYGSSKVASYYRKLMEVNEVNFNIIRKAEQAHPRRPNIINVVEEEVRIDMGNITQVAGELAYKALEMATEDLLKGSIDVLVTAPISKKNIQSANFQFPGHTEYLANRCKVEDSLMLMVNRDFRIGVVTGHIPLMKVSGSLTKELILRKIKILNNSLIQDFGIIKPRIALLALNPHAGDDGLIGAEDQQIIKPAIDDAFAGGILAFGPYPADGFLGAASFREFDGILAMYHDQGMIPFKLVSFDEGVNFTAGLPVVRTSPAHGTAFDIAGKNQANPQAFRNALFQGCDIYTNRMQYRELLKHGMKTSQKENDIVQE